MAKRRATPTAWRNRIVDHGEVNPADLVAHPRNFRSHPKHQQAAMRGVLREVGLVQDVIVNRTSGLIVDGHLRVALALEDGQASIPVVYVDLTDGEEALVLATFDPIGSLAETNREVLEDLLRNVSTGDAALQEMLSKLAESNGILGIAGGTSKPTGDPDAVPELPAAPRSRSGELWVLGRHRLLSGDSTVKADVERLMGGQKADMVFTDPPYNVAYVGKTKDALRIENDSMVDAAFFQFLLDAYTQMLAHTKPGGAIYVCHADSEGANFRRAMTDAGWLLKQCIIWAKSAFVMGRQDYHWQHEPILYGWAPGSAHSWHGDRKQSTVWNFERPNRNDSHPTMKPVELVELALANSSAPGNTILDLFGGSGTTLIAAEKTGRANCSMEIDPRYVDVILDRWSTFTGEDPVREDGALWSQIKGA